jgi:hypothetical protein
LGSSEQNERIAAAAYQLGVRLYRMDSLARGDVESERSKVSRASKGDHSASRLCDFFAKSAMRYRSGFWKREMRTQDSLGRTRNRLYLLTAKRDGSRMLQRRNVALEQYIIEESVRMSCQTWSIRQDIWKRWIRVQDSFEERPLCSIPTNLSMRRRRWSKSATSFL